MANVVLDQMKGMTHESQLWIRILLTPCSFHNLHLLISVVVHGREAGLRAAALGKAFLGA